MGLSWGDIGFKNGVMSITKQKLKSGEISPPKTGETRDILLFKELKDLLLNFSQGSIHSNNLFNHGRDYYRKAKDRIRDTYGLSKIRMHDFKHSHATMLIMNNVSDVVVSERLGHASIQTTQRVYTHLYNDKKRKS